MSHAWVERTLLLLMVSAVILIAIGGTLAVALRVPLPVPTPALIAGAAE